MSFESLTPDELYRTAIEDFAVEVNKDDKPEVIMAALVESGVTWKMYEKMHKKAAPNVVTSASVTGKDLTENTVVRTKASEVDLGTDDSYLVKMERDNPYFEYKGYKFTQEHPFAIMSAADTNALLRKEDGFSIARPDEAQAYYESV
jgi:hypothetical protein